MKHMGVHDRRLKSLQAMAEPAPQGRKLSPSGAAMSLVGSWRIEPVCVRIVRVQGERVQNENVLTWRPAVGDEVGQRPLGSADAGRRADDMRNPGRAGPVCWRRRAHGSGARLLDVQGRVPVVVIVTPRYSGPSAAQPLSQPVRAKIPRPTCGVGRAERVALVSARGHDEQRLDLRSGKHALICLDVHEEGGGHRHPAHASGGDGGLHPCHDRFLEEPCNLDRHAVR